MILIKQHNSLQVANLYQRLFMAAVDDLFYDHELFPYLDYEYTATTLGGVVQFGIDLYTKEAKDLSENIRETKISLDNEIFHATILQLATSLQHNVSVANEGSINWDVVREELLLLDSKPWQDIKDVDIIDPKHTAFVPGSFYIPKDKTKLEIRKIRVTFQLDEEFTDQHKELLPLYCELSEFMSENIYVDLYSNFGFYSMDADYNSKTRAHELTHLFHTVELSAVKPSSVRKVVEESVSDLHEFKAFHRLTSHLHHASHTKADAFFPGVNRTFRRTHLIVGEKGWQRIATDENCRKILSHMYIVIGVGRSKTSVNIASILDIK